MPEIEAKTPKPTVLVQLDTDPQPSVFDAVVAVDSGVDHLLRHGNVRPEEVRDLVHGALFTRGIEDLRRSAVFVGGSDVSEGEAILRAVEETFFGPFRVSVFQDSNGSNTTASAAVLAIVRSLGHPSGWEETRVAILGAGAVGRRVAHLLARLGASVRIGTPGANQAIEGVEQFLMKPNWQEEIARSTAIVAAGPAGVNILPAVGRDQFPDLRVAIDLNAVPPHGLGNIKPNDRDEDRDGIRGWGALGVGALKMKIHKAVIQALFDDEPNVFDVERVFQVGRNLL